MATYTTMLPSPIGPLELRSNGDALTGLYMREHRHRPAPDAGASHDPGPFVDAEQQLDAYFAGERTRFDLPVQLSGTPFQLDVWAALQELECGETVSYAELAMRIGRAAAVRAVGLANGKNPVSIVVPCHRVVGADGSLTGYGGGIERKRFLLDLEARVAGVFAAQ